MVVKQKLIKPTEEWVSIRQYNTVDGQQEHTLTILLDSITSKKKLKKVNKIAKLIPEAMWIVIGHDPALIKLAVTKVHPVIFKLMLSCRDQIERELFESTIANLANKHTLKETDVELLESIEKAKALQKEREEDMRLARDNPKDKDLQRAMVRKYGQ